MGLVAPPKPRRSGLQPRESGSPRSSGPPKANPAIALEGAQRARAARGEVRPLEIDWSQIVRRCMDGDSSAWAELVRAQHRRVYGLCYRFTGNPTDAEDLTQDVFLKIYSNLASFDTGARLPAGVDHHHDPQPAGG